MKNKLTGMLVVVFLVVFAIMMLSGNKIEHIEDMNGPDIYSLTTITDSNIINRDVGAKGFSKTESSLSDLVEYKSKKFTGVEEIYSTNVMANRMDITMTNLQVHSGNLKVVVVYNDQIVHEFKVNEMGETFTLEKPKGNVSVRVAGESADFYLTYDVI